MRYIIFYLGLFSSVSFAATETWFERFKQHDLAVSNGNGHIFDDQRNDFLTWGESYILNAYLTAYKVSKDIYWLDKFIAHSHVANNRLEDVDMDGYVGWPIARYAQNLLQNGGFDQFKEIKDAVLISSWSFENEVIGTGLSNINEWHRWQANESQAYLEFDQSSESYVSAIETDGVDWRALELGIADYEANILYNFSCETKVINGDSKPNVNVRLESRRSLKKQLIFPEFSEVSQWQKDSVFFRSPSYTGDVIKLRLESQLSSTVGKIAFDNCLLQKVENTDAMYWEYWQSTSQTIHVKNDELKINTNPSRGWQVLQSSLHNPYTNGNPFYEPNTLYKVKFRAKASSSIAGGQVQIFDWTQRRVIKRYNFDNIDWQVMSFNFRTPYEANHNIQIRLTHSDWLIKEGTVWFDDISIQKFSDYKVDDAMMIYQYLLFANLVKQDPQLKNNYWGIAEQFVDLGKLFVEKWEDLWIENQTMGTYLSRLDGSLRAYSGCSLPLNQVAMPGNVIIELYKYTNDNFYFNKAKKIAGTFHYYLNKTNNNAYNWHYYENIFPEELPAHCNKSPVTEDVSHANLDVEFIRNAFESEISFSKEDIQFLVNTLKLNMWNGDYINPLISSRVSGAIDVISGEYLWWWIDLAQYDPELLPIVNSVWENQEIYSINPLSPIDPETGVWVGQSWKILQKAKLSYWFKLINKVRGGDFNNIELSDNWSRWQSSEANAFINSENVLEIKSAPTWQVVQQDISYNEEVEHTLHFESKTENGAKFYVQIFDWTENKVLALKVGSSSYWNSYQLKFKTPKAGHRVSLRLMPLSLFGGNTVYFDNIIITEKTL